MIKVQPQPKSKGLGFFWSQSQCTTSVSPVAWGQAVAQADDIFGDDPNTPV